MPQGIDYSLLDQPQILQYAFYPRREWSTAPAGATDHVVAVDEGVEIVCRLYVADPGWPTLVYFHGNGEVVTDHDWIAPLYHARGTNLFVADYRGYGRSGGYPSFATMTLDAGVIFRHFLSLRPAAQLSGPVFAMGRSLGSHSALELAASDVDALRGVIIESGLASPAPWLRLLGPVADRSAIEALHEASMARLRAISLPMLILHGEYDSIVPVEQARILYENVSSPDKDLVIIPGAEHNDIMLVGGELYFKSIGGFLGRHGSTL